MVDLTNACPNCGYDQRIGSHRKIAIDSPVESDDGFTFPVRLECWVPRTAEPLAYHRITIMPATVPHAAPSA